MGAVFDLSLPTSWDQLTDKQLRLVFNLFARDLSGAEVKALCLFRWNKMEVVNEHPEGTFLVKRGKEQVMLTARQIQQATAVLDFLDELPTAPVRLARIGRHRALAADFEGVPLEKFLFVEMVIARCLFLFQFCTFLRCMSPFLKRMLTFVLGMNRRHCAVWFLTAICAVLLAVVANWQVEAVVSEQDDTLPIESAVMSPLQQQPHEATLTDATQLYRICSSRPQRLLPSQSSRSIRTLTPTFNAVRQRIVKPLHSFYDSRCRVESAPFCLSASCDYYVIALRHIIR